MTKQGAIQAISGAVGLPATEVKKVVEELLKVIKGRLKGGESVHFRGFGSFTRKRRAQKIVRDIGRGKSMVLPPRDVPCFKPSKQF